MAFGFLSIQQYIQLSNFSSGASLYFHCIAWCVTSFIRYLYIEKEDWVHSIIPSHKLKTTLSAGLTLCLYPLFAFPPFGYAMLLGEIIFACMAAGEIKNCHIIVTQPPYLKQNVFNKNFNYGKHMSLERA